MKLKLFFAMALFMSIVACSNSDKGVMETDEVGLENLNPYANNELVFVLQHFNDSIRETKVESRSFFKKLLHIVIADVKGALAGGLEGGIRAGCETSSIDEAISGALIGAAIGGVGTSIKAWSSGCGLVFSNITVDMAVVEYTKIKEAMAELDDTTWSAVDATGVSIPSPFKSAYGVGAYHNLALDALINQTESRSGSEIIINDPYELLSDLERYVLTSPEYIACFNKEIDEVDNLDLDNFIPDPDSTADYVMNLFVSIYSQYVDTTEDAAFVINRYIEEIENSDILTDLEKQIVYDALSVAAYSYNYWNDKFKVDYVEVE